MENDEPLFFTSSSDEEDEPIAEEIKDRASASKQVNPRKRPAGGHTPLDLARCQKVSCGSVVEWVVPHSATYVK